MRLHLVISRHGLPITRILWTTTTASTSVGGLGYGARAHRGTVASTSNLPLANGGYTVAQLLEDVNEVVPLETEPSVFDPEFSGQWGLEDYVVEVDGSECLHFMEIEGLLRDGDEVVIRSLELADLRARRLCGRHQITSEGRHLIDGVPFGSPFSKRSSATRPTITIPPRKKRRTVFSGWDQVPGYANEEPNADEEGDGEWLPPNAGFGKELSILPADQEVSEMGTVIRHPIDHSAEEDEESDADISEPEEAELESELKALKADFEEPASQFIDIRNQAQSVNPAVNSPGPGPTLRSSLVDKRPSSADSGLRGSIAGASSLSSKRSRADEFSPRASKAVRFSRGDKELHSQLDEAVSSSESEAESSSSSAKSSKASSDSDSDEQMSDSSNASESSSDSSSDTSSDDSDSESEGEKPKVPQKVHHLMAPPGEGSIRTKKSNHRYKMRRRLSKLKEMGVLPAEADFAALRAWADANGGWYFDESSVMSTTMSKADRKEQEHNEFEAKRQKLLRDLASGGVAVDEVAEKENLPPSTAKESTPQKESEEPEEESSRRTLDVASSRRLLFGSLGLRTPKTKEDEEETRRKLAAQASTVSSRRKSSQARPSQVEEAPVEDEDIDWKSKLDIRATECVYDDIQLTTPPFPFKNRWDKEADAIVRERMGWGKKRKRKQRAQVYDEEEDYDDEGYAYNHGYNEYDESYMELNYDEAEAEGDADAAYDGSADHEPAGNAVDDLPSFPSDANTLTDLIEDEVKPGAIIAFRQLDMSKATNWQPRMSEYRVAEVHEIVDDGLIKMRLAVRDRRPKADIEEDDDEPRLYDGFEMPGMDEEEDDGYRELAFAELSDPKLLRTGKLEEAPGELELEKGKGKDGVHEGSIVSVVEDSMPNPFAVRSPIDMDLDDTTFVTGANEQNPDRSPDRASDVVSVQTPGGVRLPQPDATDEEQNEPLAVPSPSFSGFYSASPGAGLGVRINEEECQLDGHTLIDEQSVLDHTLIGEPSVLGDTNQDGSALSFLSASVNQSTADIPPSRQVVHDNLVPFNVPVGSNHDSLLSSMHLTGGETGVRDGAMDTDADAGGVEVGAEAGEGIERFRDGTSDLEDLPPFDYSFNPSDNLIHSEESLHITPKPSSSSHSRSTSHSSRKAPTSAQQEPESNSSPEPNHDNKPSHSPSPSFSSQPPAASTRSKRSSQLLASQPASQVLDFIDLTRKSSASPPSADSAWTGIEGAGEGSGTRTRTRASSRVQQSQSQPQTQPTPRSRLQTLSSSPSKIPKRKVEVKAKPTKKRKKKIEKPEWRI